MRFAENEVEDAALEWLSGLGYAVLHGPDISPDGPTPERVSYDQVLLTVRLREALERLDLRRLRQRCRVRREPRSRGAGWHQRLCPQRHR